MLRLISWGVAFALLASPPVWAASSSASPAWFGDAAATARMAPDKPARTELRPFDDPTRIVVKFREGTGVRLRQGMLAAAPGEPVAAVAQALARAGVASSRMERLFARPEAELDRERAEAMRRTGRELADLNLYYIARLPPGADAAAVVDTLNALPMVELAAPAPRPAPPPVDIAPPTPSFVDGQGYRAAAPRGIGAGLVPNGDGRGMRIVDVEYSWVLDHEDIELPASANIETAFTPLDPFPQDEANHGTAVLGMLGGKANAYGVTGIAPAAQALVAPANTVQAGYNPARAIDLATARLSAGDVILIEQQYWACDGRAYGPLEWLQPVYDAIAAATAKGIVVVEAAGNGSIDLDGASCLGRFNRAVRHSGAIIVGAGHPDTRDRLGFSSYGSRVDMQGWGMSVTTTGLGDAFAPEIRQRYTRSFNGTSSAAPIVAGAVLAVNGALKAQGLAPATSGEMRGALVATGTPQGAGGHIGPLPNVPAALERILKQRGVGPSWKPWEAVGGPALVGRPECVVSAAGQIDCFVNTAAGRVAWNRWTASGWRGWADLGGAIGSGLSCLPQGSKLHCFAIGTGKRLQQNVFDGAAWSGWVSRSAATLAAQRPSCVGWGTTGIRCYAVTAAQKLAEYAYDGRTWQAPRDLGGAPRGRPSCVRRAGGIDCLAISTGNRMGWMRYDGKAWSRWALIGGTVTLATSPSCAILGTALHCFAPAAGSGGTGPLMTARLTGATWSAWSSLGGTVKDQPSCIPFGAGGIACFAQTGTNTLLWKAFDGTAWAAGKNLGGSIAGRALCVSPSTGRIDCFAPGSDRSLKRISYY